ADDSQRGFVSDYNVLYATGTGKLARWQGRDFTNLADWYYEVGQDQHSLTADPRFVAPDGPDGLFGYTTGGLRGSYFANETLTGEPALVRTDATVDFSWGFGQPPAPGLPDDHFSIRWQGFVYVPRAGDYTIYAVADDGGRLYLDGQLVIDRWT